MHILRTAFTIVELLVVVTIIVILLALLTPAMDQAVYQAEMTVCGTNARAAALAGLSYAGDHQRRYPYRRHAISTNQTGSYGIINMNLLSTAPGMDDRVLFRGYMSINKTLNCPLNYDLDYERSDGTKVYIYSDYGMWMGMAYGGQRGMLKLGDRVAWDDHDTGEPQTSNALLGSFAARDDVGGVYTDHPDVDNLWREWHGQDAPNWWNGSTTITWSLYRTPERFPYVFDVNFAMDDGSVQRHDEVTPETKEGIRWVYAWTSPTKAPRLVTPIPRN